MQKITKINTGKEYSRRFLLKINFEFYAKFKEVHTTITVMILISLNTLSSSSDYLNIIMTYYETLCDSGVHCTILFHFRTYKSTF